MSSFHKPEKLLFDILQAAQQIQEFTKDQTKETFLSNDLVASACERKFEIIGEAINRLKKQFPKVAHGIPEAEKIIGFRNIIAHGYDIVDAEIIWDTIQTCIPQLIKTIKKQIPA